MESVIWYIVGWSIGLSLSAIVLMAAVVAVTCMAKFLQEEVIDGGS